MKQSEFEDLLKQNNFLSSFFQDIDNKLKSTNCYIEVVVDWCERNDIPIEILTKELQSNTIALDLLKESAQKLNFLKKERRIPV
jgi:hypothetical protein